MFNRFRLLSSVAILVLLGGATGLLWGQEEPSDPVRIQGTWQLVSGEKGGTAFQEEVVKSIQLVFSAETMTTKSGANEFPFPYKLIADTNPSAIDLDMN